MTSCYFKGCNQPVDIVYAGIPVCAQHMLAHERGDVNLIQLGIDEGKIERTEHGWKKKGT